MKDFDEFISRNKDNTIKVTKLKALAGKSWSSGIATGESFQGQASLRHFDSEDSVYGAGAVLLLGGGYIMNTSMIKDAVQKGPSRWLIKTLNSVYRVEVIT